MKRERMSPEAETQLWRENAQSLTLIAKEILADGIERQEPLKNFILPTEDDPYEILAMELLGGFVHKVKQERLQNGGVSHGFLVLSRLAKHGVRSYADFCRETDRESRLDELSYSLKSKESYDETVGMFSKLPRKLNAHYEVCFGLKSKNSRSAFDTPPFEFIESTDGQLIFQPSSQTLYPTKLAAIRNGLAIPSEEIRPYEKCHAQGFPLNRLWDITIDACTEDPQLFERDLGITQRQQAA
jgi:hypothetical protein